MKRFLSAVAARLLETRSTLLVLLVCAAWLAMLAGARSLMLPDEGRYIGVAWAMLRSGDWLTPTLDGLPYFHKPPLFYWLTGLALQLFGVNEWAGRLASVFGALLAVGGLFLFVRRYAGERPATLAAAVLVTQPMFFAGAQYANLDMLVAGMISATIVCAAHAILRLDSGRSYRPALAAAYVFAALGVLAKGLIGIVLPGAIVLAWLLLRRRYRLIPALLALPMIGLFVAVAAPWFVWMQISYHGFWDYFFVYHHFQRFAHTGFSNAQPFWFYLPVLFLGTLPWAPWIWRACAWKYLVDPEKVEIRSLMLVWMLGILVFFSLPNSKLVGYILPALPPLAFLIADGFLDWRQKRQAERAAKAEIREQGADASLYLGASLVGGGVLCVVLIILVAVLDSTSTRSLSRQVAPLYSPDAQMVMIDEYEYDLPFYLRPEKDVWVVSDWQDTAAIAARDNWRKELYDAGQFDSAKMREVLLMPGEFVARLCAYTGASLWVWGKTAQAQHYSFLPEEAIAFANPRRTVWRLDAEQRRRLQDCQPTTPAG
ncbi:glycosyltransferase family 39 protein [Candidatus Accumulibacter sp. ACC007]|uniref:ArnT family glycosyltransferase n=1 Tax=Candidatus Accumulibacter sp. ACC007 TaxID=2823333 RepID=UPI0025C1BDE1|nr:glycosyltransferase family 39 protein [Candidatus Accumulibacter sp. ACC007]